MRVLGSQDPQAMEIIVWIFYYIAKMARYYWVFLFIRQLFDAPFDHPCSFISFEVYTKQDLIAQSHFSSRQTSFITDLLQHSLPFPFVAVRHPKQLYPELSITNTDTEREIIQHGLADSHHLRSHGTAYQAAASGLSCGWVCTKSVLSEPSFVESLGSRLCIKLLFLPARDTLFFHHQHLKSSASSSSLLSSIFPARRRSQFIFQSFRFLLNISASSHLFNLPN
jgi:hypothetical protein